MTEDQLGLFCVKIGNRGYYVCEAVASHISELKAAVKPLANMDCWITSEHDDCDSIEECNSLTVSEIRAARLALGDKDG